MINDEMSFYGVITEIWELDYEKFRIPIFNCDWVDNGRGVVVDELGFTLANLNKKCHFNDTFVLGKVIAPSKKSTPKKSKKVASNKTAGSASAIISTASKKKKSKNYEEESEKGLKLLKRNYVAMKRISRSRSLKQQIVVQFNRTGTPYGKAATEMKSYIGVLARRKIPIVRTTWRTASKKVPGGVTAEEKEKIWEREQELRKTQQTRRRMNKYPHQLSRKGYVGLVVELKAKAKPAQAMPEEASTISSEDELYEKCETWVAARVTKESKFTDEETKKKVEEIEKVSTGETSLSGYDDVLEKALGKEHGGRVRGVAVFVNPTTYFHLPRRNGNGGQAGSSLAGLDKPIPPVSGQASCSNTADLSKNDMHDQVQAPNAQVEIEEVIEKNIKGQVKVSGQVEGNDEPGVKLTLIFKCLEAMEVNEVTKKKTSPKRRRYEPRSTQPEEVFGQEIA
ncbi:hypothetical protein ACLB2K_062780 [Fragaria x ananassa]